MRWVFILFFMLSSFIFSEEDKSFPKNSFLTEETASETTPDFNYRSAFIRMLISLVALMLFIFLTFWAFKRLMRSRIASTNQSRAIKILEKRAISPKSILYLIEVENEKILIAESHLEIRPVEKIK